MATAIEWGLITALVAVAGITVYQNVTDDDPIVAECTAKSANEWGEVGLDCGEQSADLQLYTTDTDVVLFHTLRDLPMECELRTNREAVCRTPT